MRIGERCVFTVDKDMFGGKIKAGHKYVGKCAGDLVVLYRNYRINVKSIKKAEKTPVIKEKAPTASDYKNFADLCFEVGVRYRDNWTSVISGKKFEEGDWNGLQAGHGCSRQYWDTRHVPVNCHAITSGENYQMSLGNATTIMKYWTYVANKYGQHVVDSLVNMKHENTKLSISYLKGDCKYQYDWLFFCVVQYFKKNNLFNPDTDYSPHIDYIIKWRCAKLPNAKANGIMKVLKIIKGEQ